MFLFQETYYVRPGLQDVIDQRVRSLHENHASNDAFVAADWAKYLGDATTYLAFRLWQHNGVEYNEAQRAFMSEYNRTRPADAFLAPPDIELFEQVDQQGVSGGAGALVRCDLTIAGQAVWPAWEQELKQRLAADAACSEYRLYRFLGAENRYLRAEFWQSPEAAMAFWRAPELREFTTRLSPGLRRAPSFGFYEVLHQLGSARPQAPSA